MPAVSYIFIPGGSNQPVILGNDAVGDRVSGGYPDFAPRTELVLFGGSNFALPIEHGNAASSMSWRVERYHGTASAAMLFLTTHAQNIPVILGIAQGVLQELLDDGTTHFYQNCTRPKCKCVAWDGASTIFEYTVQFSQVTDQQAGN